MKGRPLRRSKPSFLTRAVKRRQFFCEFEHVRDANANWTRTVANLLTSVETLMKFGRGTRPLHDQPLPVNGENGELEPIAFQLSPKHGNHVTRDFIDDGDECKIYPRGWLSAPLTRTLTHTHSSMTHVGWVAHSPIVQFDQLLRLFGLALGFETKRLRVENEHLLELCARPVEEERGRVFRHR